MIPAATILPEGSLHPHPKQGATQTGVEEATKRFKKYQPYVFSSHMPGHPDIEKVEGVWQYRIRTCLVENLIGQGYLQKASKLIKKLGIKIVHVRNRPLYMPVLRKLLGKGYILILHEHNQNIADTLSEKQAIDVFESIDAYVAVSRFTYDFEITNKYPQYKNKSYVILNGVNLEKFRPLWKQSYRVEDLKKHYNLENSKVVLFAGALRERKGVHFLLEAFKKVIIKHPDAKLVIAGGDKDNLEAKDLFARKLKDIAAGLLGNVIFTGYIPPSLIQDIFLLGDIFVGPSIWDEAFGLVFAEASASGLAVIGSRRGGIPEIIQDAVTGLLLDDPEDSSEIADKIIYLLDSPEKREQFGHAARKYMEENFSWDRVANEIETLYDKLLSKPPLNLPLNKGEMSEQSEDKGGKYASE
jgi:spore coat protein SA